MAENIYNAKKLTMELQAAALPVASVASTGEIAYQRDLTAKEKETAEAVVNSHDPGKTDQEIERDAYYAAGISLEDMIFALWKKVVLEDSQDADDLQVVISEALAGIEL